MQIKIYLDHNEKTNLQVNQKFTIFEIISKLCVMIFRLIYMKNEIRLQIPKV